MITYTKSYTPTADGLIPPLPVEAELDRIHTVHNANDAVRRGVANMEFVTTGKGVRYGQVGGLDSNAFSRYASVVDTNNANDMVTHDLTVADAGAVTLPSNASFYTIVLPAGMACFADANRLAKAVHLRLSYVNSTLFGTGSVYHPDNAAYTTDYGWIIRDNVTAVATDLNYGIHPMLAPNITLAAARDMNAYTVAAYPAARRANDCEVMLPIDPTNRKIQVRIGTLAASASAGNPVPTLGILLKGWMY